MQLLILILNSECFTADIQLQTACDMLFNVKTVSDLPPHLLSRSSLYAKTYFANNIIIE